MSNTREVGEFAAIGREIGELVEQKNQAYGSAFQHSADLLKLFFPNGVKPEQYTDLLLIARISDKLFRIANKKNAFNESPYGDIIGYGILGKWNDEHLPSTEVRVPVGGEPHGKHFKAIVEDPVLRALLEKTYQDEHQKTPYIALERVSQ